MLGGALKQRKQPEILLQNEADDVILASSALRCCEDQRCNVLRFFVKCNTSPRIRPMAAGTTQPKRKP